VHFSDGSPFGAGLDVEGNADHVVKAKPDSTLGRRTFRYSCGITANDGTVFGWPGKDDPDSGGEVIIVQR
jgi:hypothetical protein